jgi:hypothetical protein
MRRIKIKTTLIVAAAWAVCLSSAGMVLAAASTGAAESSVVSSSWQHHKVSFPYHGVTSIYNCDALESTVRAILLHLGARKDLTVVATGCGPAKTPGPSAFIDTDFYTLAPSVDSGPVAAHWTVKQLDPEHPYFMGGGACELIDQMKDLITKNFSLRDLEYRTDCVPHDIVINGFLIKCVALTAVAGAKT